jgi:hypothetical protein
VTKGSAESIRYSVAVRRADRVANQWLNRRHVSRHAPQTLQTLLLTGLAWFLPPYVQGGDAFQALTTLRPDVSVRAVDGHPGTVLSETPEPGPRTLHNLTVEVAPTYLNDAEVSEGWGWVGFGFLNGFRWRDLGGPTLVSAHTDPQCPTRNHGRRT